MEKLTKTVSLPLANVTSLTDIIQMKIVKFLGGLGNQMFQYAFYLTLQNKFKKVKADLTDFETYPLHNGFELNSIFGIELDTVSKFELNLYLPHNRKWIWRKLRRLYRTKHAYMEETMSFAYDKAIFSDTQNRYYWGYWQDVDYVNMVAQELREHFRFPVLNDSKNKELLRHIRQHTTVALHVRRGDYLNEVNTHLGSVCDTAYYERAIAYILEKVASPLFVVFSNDIPWCQETFAHIDAVFVDWNTDRQSYIDMQLMSLCNHNIIANSSFSWWGAWLNSNTDKIVVSPNKWINTERENSDGRGLILDSFVTF
ncbi:alpha-1,2-fucosyltransferase [Sphingobacterium haloxyli]|uniref:Alpha-1,2-fucosyltransferase n=1 Tax=Sphingobacterium haloxyli TaxID=2100533 RepID=A0A2S9J0E2_9SPHI|nr:alpha-1,2-fucosyltransferase [Sphingobacterium haloxyli]PRD46220.1 alpha-1,2-fucosyltransferase [Sphingobacterium haloxyli]